MMALKKLRRISMEFIYDIYLYNLYKNQKFQDLLFLIKKEVTPIIKEKIEGGLQENDKTYNSSKEIVFNSLR